MYWLFENLGLIQKKLYYLLDFLLLDFFFIYVFVEIYD